MNEITFPQLPCLKQGSRFQEKEKKKVSQQYRHLQFAFWKGEDIYLSVPLTLDPWTESSGHNRWSPVNSLSTWSSPVQPCVSHWNPAPSISASGPPLLRHSGTKPCRKSSFQRFDDIDVGINGDGLCLCSVTACLMAVSISREICELLFCKVRKMMKGCWIKQCKGKAVEKEEEINTWLADEEERGEREKEK